MWHVINVVQIVVVHPLNLFHLKLSQTSIILSSAQEKVLRHSFKIDLYFSKTCTCIYVYSSHILHKMPFLHSKSEVKIYPVARKVWQIFEIMVHPNARMEWKTLNCLLWLTQKNTLHFLLFENSTSGL